MLKLLTTSCDIADGSALDWLVSSRDSGTAPLTLAVTVPAALSAFTLYCMTAPPVLSSPEDASCADA